MKLSLWIMTYSYQKTRSNKKIFTYIGVFFVICCIVLFIFRNSFTLQIHKISSIVNTWSQTKKTLTLKIGALESRMQELQDMQTETRLLRDENTSLRNLLKYTKDPNTIVATAEIISKPYRSSFDRMVINQGSDQGIATGDLVIAGDHVLLGTIEQVSEVSAIVHLLSSSTYKHTGDFIIKNLGIPVSGKPTGSGNFTFEVPIGMNTSDGDIVVIANYPDKAIAVIKSVDIDPRSPFQKALARTPVNLSELKFVQVVRP
jgi:cell shape-determining protein MreC